MSQYSIKEQSNQDTGEKEYVVLNAGGIIVPPPNTFRDKGAAIARQAVLEAEHDAELAEQRKGYSSPGCN